MNIAEELWADIPGYENKYRVSNYGRIISLSRRDSIGRNLQEKFLKPQLDGKSYYFVALWNNNSYKQYGIHQLVMLAFVGGYPYGTEINHKDGRKTNNNLDNLEYVTPSQNKQHAWDNGLSKTTDKKIRSSINNIRKASESNKKMVAQIYKGEIIAIHSSLKDAAKKLNINPCCISACVTGRQSTSHGYEWKEIT
jgi:hypothetical protein